MQALKALEPKAIDAFVNYSFDQVVPHLQRDMDWLMAKLPNDAYAQMQMDRIQHHIIGTVLKERALAIKQYQDEIDDWAMKQMIPIIWEDT